MDVKGLVETKARAAAAAARALALTPTRVRNEALAQMARGLEEKTAPLLEANRADLERARGGGATRAFLDRLTLTEDRIAEMAAGLRQIRALPDPVGETVDAWRRPNGIEIARVRVPLGVIGFIYESRPNVTADAAGLCVKSGNAVLLRGGEEFVRWVARHSRVPVLKHDKGLVHVFVDAAADLEMAAAITVNAKVQRPSVCNALETLLVDRAVAGAFVPMVVARLVEAGVEVRGCPATRALAPGVRAATDADWDAEYLDLILAVRVVDGLDDAIAHIRLHG